MNCKRIQVPHNRGLYRGFRDTGYLPFTSRDIGYYPFYLQGYRILCSFFCVLSGILIFWGYIKIMFSRKCDRTSSVVNTLGSGARGPRSDPLL